MRPKLFFKRRSVSLGALALLGVVATSACGVPEARGYSSWAMEADGSVANTMPQSAYGEVVQEPVDENPIAYKRVTYDDAVSKFGMTANEDAFGSYMGEGLIGFRFGLAGIFWRMVDDVPTDDREATNDLMNVSAD